MEEEWAAITADEVEALVDTVSTRLREVNTLTACDQLLNTNKTIVDTSKNNILRPVRPVRLTPGTSEC